MKNSNITDSQLNLIFEEPQKEEVQAEKPIDNLIDFKNALIENRLELRRKALEECLRSFEERKEM